MKPVCFIVDGDPVPQPRPMVSTRGGYGRAYVPAKHPVHQFRARVAHAAKAAGLTETASPVAVTIEARFGRPRSHYRKAGVKPTAPALPGLTATTLPRVCWMGCRTCSATTPGSRD